jgi:type VI secretion system secreted protein VgrG
MATTTNPDLLFTFELGRSDLPAFHVVRFEGTEAVSRPYRFDITLVADDANVDLDNVLGATAPLRIWSRDHSRSVPYHGMLAEFEQLGHVDNYFFYRATLVPRLWRLGLNRINDVYLNEQSIPDIVGSLLERNGLKGPYWFKASTTPSKFQNRYKPGYPPAAVFTAR